jgi:parallel beta-helix repeat protein
VTTFIQTDEIQECEFELVVSDGELTSLPDTVRVIIVPDFGTTALREENPPFDPNKPTLIYFGGGNCVNGLQVDCASPFTSAAWLSKANIINFRNGYGPDSGGNGRTYYKYGDMIIAHLSNAAPDYRQPIQTSGWSTGGQPAIDVGIHLNLTYADARYAINRVTFCDATSYCRDNYSESIPTFLRSSVDGEQCWVDAYASTTGGGGYGNYPPFHENVLNVWFPTATGGWYNRHILAHRWYANSLVLAEANDFNHGVVAGAYFSVIGPGKNLQLASTPHSETYKFSWYGNASSGYMDFCDEPNHPGRLPGPVTLIGPADGTFVDANGTVLSCQESENAVGYQLLFGADPYHLTYQSSDTPAPPTEIITTFPFERTFWTVMARDQHGSTIYADPICLYAENVEGQPIANVMTGRRYGSIQLAINDALPGEEIVVSPGAYQYLENLDLKGKDVTVRSTDPNNPAIVAATIINGGTRGPAVKFSSGEDQSCVIAGFTLVSDAWNCLYCYGSSPTIANCVITNDNGAAVELRAGSEPAIVDCTIVGSVIGPNLFVDDDAANDPGPGDPTVSHSLENGSPQRPFDSIQEAINTAYPGETLIVLPGTYAGNGNCDLDLGGKPIVVRAKDGPESCIVDCQNSGRGFYFHSGEGVDSLLEGFTIINGNADRGGGICCLNNSSPTIVNCMLSENSATSNGGGMFNESNSTPKLINCTFSRNSALMGGGLYNEDASPMLANCTVTGNTALLLGGGILNDGGMCILTDSIVWANTASTPGQVLGVASASHSNIQGGFFGEGNIDTDPLFSDPDNGDYHLKSQDGRWDPVSESWVRDDVTSPCIDAGDPGSDWTAELWPHGKRINMGVYGGTPQASMSLSAVGNAGDCNNDGAVDAGDLLALSERWLTEDAPAAEDINRNGSVNFLDYASLVQDWFQQQP